MPFCLKEIEDFPELEECKSVLIIPCRFCPAASLAVSRNEPYIELFRRFLKTASFEKFIKTKKKAKYIYRLTPEGLDQIARLTFDSLNLRIKEYNRIKKEIKHLSEQIGDIDPNFCLDSEMIPGLKEDLKKLQS